MVTLAGNLERVRYYAGKLLTSEDFDAEQAYLLDHLRRHHRYLHGWGVVVGLEVSLSGSDEVVVAPGLAIDCAGNEIAVAECVRVAMPPDAASFWVAVRYAERAVTPVQTPEGTDFTRIREGADVVLLADNPSANHKGHGPGTPGCGLAHPLSLATVTRRRARWTLKLQNRR